MEQKDTYTLMELFNNLPITMTELKKRSGLSDVTLASIRDGNSARRSSLNILLAIFSDIYKVPLSHDNVSGIVIKDKLARMKAPKSQSLPSQIDEKAPVLTSEETTTSPLESPRKRSYTHSRGIPDDLPIGTVTHFDFAKQHNVNPRTFSDQITKGIGRGKEEKDKVDAIIRPKENRPDETDKYLTLEQQEKALDYWRRYGTKFTE